MGPEAATSGDALWVVARREVLARSDEHRLTCRNPKMIAKCRGRQPVIGCPSAVIVFRAGCLLQSVVPSLTRPGHSAVAAERGGVGDCFASRSGASRHRRGICRPAGTRLRRDGGQTIGRLRVSGNGSFRTKGTSWSLPSAITPAAAVGLFANRRPAEDLCYLFDLLGLVRCAHPRDRHSSGLGQVD